MGDQSATAHAPVQRIKFDRWMFDHDVDNVTAADLLDAHPVSVGRWRKAFSDPARRIPPPDIIRKVHALTAGAVAPEDWYRPCGVNYLPEPAVLPTDLA